MATFDVTIEGRVRKTIRVKARGETSAVEKAHELFVVAPEDGVSEDYDEEIISCKKVVDKS